MDTSSYEDSGVSIKNGEILVNSIKSMVKNGYNENVVGTIGGFCALYQWGDNYLASSTDGVGTKLLLAQELGDHSTVGIDLVAMSVNDLICSGARPLFFLDYFGTGKLSPEVATQVIAGIVEGCNQCKIPLIGGETAEMPGMYPNGEYDLAGFAMGMLEKKKLISGENIKPGSALIGLPSNGFHSNGYSLIRKLIADWDTSEKKSFLAPTKIYVNVVLALIETLGEHIQGISHITGSGFHNIRRMNPEVSYQITYSPEKGSLVEKACSKWGIEKSELYQTFNMGIGMVIATDRPEEVLSQAKGSVLLGKVVSGNGEILINDGGENITLTKKQLGD
ncbi:MAG: phosphoribosylformylglycinamidine cyclo-ligase [Bacteriovoracaceae bacterium]|jgi:phosphoribosylformylglycinamidine cyclo-ligase|nr:phosphoribosylformylglycinamidine cyclo-ligase [Bacteriovoracaceae bacterium]